MAEYQNVFTRVQVRGPAEQGIEVPGGSWNRVGRPRFSYLLGKIGDAQLGPIYLGATGVVASLGFLIFCLMVGFNWLAAVDWSVREVFRQFWWLAVEVPPPEYGLRIPPFNDGGWFLWGLAICSLSLLMWWARTYIRARALGLGTHVAWAFAAALWFYFIITIIRPVAIGSWDESLPIGMFAHLDWLVAISERYGNFYYNPFHMLSIAFCFGSALLFAAHGATILATGRYNSEREIEQITDRGTGSERAALFWRWTMGFNATMESIHRWGYWMAILVPLVASIGLFLSGTVIESWYEWGLKHNLVPIYEELSDPARNPAAQ
ncbi:photosynthetic reaction center subunit M [Halorhodospira halochloris]|uniref:photosynthetic reaction center subunit M n=1 Tax=Halorhodospira halochloris TaxID=1052 RepID=UPI001EE8FE71|nr:photosynthetic reaction center subunit M [Halorhodospira halochloris]MCG5531693.1 photosynthetic reaction center subunit M [Halorhodospira halochloris]